MVYIPFILTSHTASAIPHNPDIKKYINLFALSGFQIRNVIMMATCTAKPKAITGGRPIIFTRWPMIMAAKALLTPKHIMTKPMLLIPQPQDTNAYDR